MGKVKKNMGENFVKSMGEKDGRKRNMGGKEIWVKKTWVKKKYG